MSDEHRWRRKCFVICLLALFIGLMGIVLPEQEDIAFEVIVNNTELCQYNHTINSCTGSRNTSTTYYANDSSIQIFLLAHANTAGANASIQLYINGTQVEHTSGRPLASAEENYKSISAIIPKGANYSATFLNYHHYEWREYPILSGRNGTLSINQTIVGGTGSQNLSQVLDQGNQAIDQKINFTNTGKWLKIGYNSFFNLMEINTSQTMYFTQNGQFVGFMGNGFAYSAYNDKPMQFGQSGINYSNIRYNTTHGTTWLGAGTASKNLNITGFDKVNMYQDLDMNNKNISNCLNCGGNQNLSQVLTQGNDALNQNINLTDGMIYINNQSIDKLMLRYRVPSNTTWVNITGLNTSRDGFYDVTSQITCRNATNLKLFVNGDINESNYTRQFVYADGATIISARQNDAGISACSQGASSTGKQRVILDAYNKTHYISEVGLNTGGVLIFFNGMYSYDREATEITSLHIRSEVVNSIGYGSEFWIYRS